ncbi:septum formation family protein [Nocardioides conyzicola]|uniref:Septum formation-related domain-containing protein n=1 Tax=Nocardioides conyzicola TaxID=1651781 RepID=A0ABP8XGF6_9ACTN
MTRALRCLGVTAVLVLLAGLLGVGPASAGETDPDPLAGAPAVGACYDLTLKQAYGHSSPKPAVECTGDETMFVTAVGEVPASFDWADVNWKKFPAAMSRKLTTTCDPATKKLLGTPTRRALTLWDSYWFAPNKREIAAGARWFSCSVALTSSTKLLDLPAAGPAKITGSIPDAVARCAKAVKGGFAAVACSASHQYRTTFSKVVRGKATDKSVLKAANRTCPRHVVSREWLYRTSWVTRTTFVLACSNKTRH